MTGVDEARQGQALAPAIWWIGMPILIGALCLGLYANALHNPLVLDDAILLERNPDVRQPEGIANLWWHDYWAGISPDRNLYRPIAVLSFHLNHRLTGTAPAPCRLVNVLLLAALGVLVAAVFVRRVPPLVALALAALFVAHPTHHAVINQVVGRGDLLAMLGVVAFLALQARAMRRGGWSLLAAAGALVAGVVAVGSKESGVLLAPVAAALAFVGDRSRARRVDPVTAFLVLVPLALFAAGRGIAAGWGVDYAPLELGARTNPLQWSGALERIPGALAIAGFYARQLVWPDLGYYHHPDHPPGWGDVQVVFGAMVLFGGLLGGAWLLRRRSWLAPFAVLALGQYAIIGNLLFPVGVYAANRFALPFTLMAAALLAAWWAARAPPARWELAAAAVGLLLLVPMVIQTREVNRAWSSASSAMRYDAMGNPDRAVASSVYGETLAAAGSLDEAVLWLTASLEQEPDNPLARVFLASTLEKLGRQAAALEQLGLALEPGPGDVRPVPPEALISGYSIRARLASSAGDLDAAERALELAAAVSPLDVRVMVKRARLARERQDAAVAGRRYRALRDAHPTNGSVLAEVESVVPWLWQQARRANEAGRHVETVELADAILALRPDFPAAERLRAEAARHTGTRR